MRAAGHGPTTIAKALGISRMSVHRALTHPAVHTSALWGTSFWDTTDARLQSELGTVFAMQGKTQEATNHLFEAVRPQ